MHSNFDEKGNEVRKSMDNNSVSLFRIKMYTTHTKQMQFENFINFFQM